MSETVIITGVVIALFFGMSGFALGVILEGRIDELRTQLGETLDVVQRIVDLVEKQGDGDE